jgi:hypothetical protein
MHLARRVSTLSKPVAQHDATIACWDTKFTYLELRPPMADPTIVPVFALPQHPGFPSGQACASGATAAVMSSMFDVVQGFVLGQQTGQQVVRHAQTDGAQ